MPDRPTPPPATSDPPRVALAPSLEQQLARVEAQLAERTRELAAERRRIAPLRALREALDRAQCAALLLADADGYVTFANARAAALLGRDAALLDGTILSELVDGGFAPLQQAVRDGAGLFDGAPRKFVRPDGSRVPVHCALAVLAREGGEPTGYLVAAVELDSRREIAEAREQQVRAAALGRLADGIAHEINTPLQFVGDTVRFLRDAYVELTPLLATLPRLIDCARRDADGADSAKFAATALADADLPFAQREVPAAAERALEGLRRIAGVVDATREVADGGGRAMAPIDLNALVRHCAALTRCRWEPRAALDLQLAAGLPKVSCHIGEICEAVVELLDAATAALAAAAPACKDPCITIHTRRRAEQVELLITSSVDFSHEPLEPVERIVVCRHRGDLQRFATSDGSGRIALRLPLKQESSR